MHSANPKCTLFTIQWIWIVRRIHSALQGYMNFFFYICTVSVNASLFDSVTFSAFFWTSEANGCFHFEMYFWLVTMVSQQIMASVCFLTHSWRRRWQSSSEKMDGKKGWKVKRMKAFKIKIIYLSESRQRSHKLSSQRSLRAVKIHADYCIHKIFYNYFLNLKVRTMWCYTFICVFHLKCTINKFCKQRK